MEKRRPRIDDSEVCDQHVIRLSVFWNFERIAGAAFGMPRSEVRGNYRAPQFDRLPILERLVDLHGIEPSGTPKQVVRLAAGFKQFPLLFHGHHFRAGLLLDQRDTSRMIAVGMRDQQDLDIGIAEAEFLDARFNLGNRVNVSRVDEDIAFWCHDQEAGEVIFADVIDIADDAMRRERLSPQRRGKHGE